MTKPTEDQPEAVPARAKRDGEILGRWRWVEPTVWTERMLTALEQGVKGGKWFSLIDKVHPERTLHAAFSQVAANKGAAGVDHVTVDDVRGPPGSEPEETQRGPAQRPTTGRSRSAGTTSPNRGARRSGRWGFRRCATGWFKRRC